MVLPVIVTLAVVKWLFGTVASFTDTLLFFLPRNITHADNGQGPMHWYWSGVAFALAIIVITVVGLFTRHYVGKKVVRFVDETMLKIPLLNKLYAAVKQVNDAITTGKGTAFKTVVLVEFPSPGLWMMGLITQEAESEAHGQGDKRFVAVFVPTTPNPTTGFLIWVPEDKVKRLDMSVADAIKWIMSLGAVRLQDGLPASELAKLIPSSLGRSRECHSAKLNGTCDGYNF